MKKLSKKKAIKKAEPSKPKKKAIKKAEPSKPKKKYVPVPPKEHQFKKGQSGNPHGLSKEKIAIKSFTASQLINAINMVTSLSAEQAEELVKDRSLPLTELVVLRALIDAAADGNYSKFYEVVEFILGKVPNKIEVISSLREKLEDREKLKQVLKEVEDEF